MEKIKEIIKIIDENWDKSNLEFKKELNPDFSQQTKKMFKVISIKLKDKAEALNFPLTFEEHLVFRKMQAEFLGIKSDIQDKKK